METRPDLNPTISILLVEDDNDTREILAGILPRKFPDVTVYSANNGRTGLELFKTHTPDIVITDINMPEMSGVQLADKIRASKVDTKLIVLTGDTGQAALESAVGKGLEVDYFILKPVNFGELFAAIEQCITETALHQSK
jgi:YesN/AraC family two-component response regulator